MFGSNSSLLVQGGTFNLNQHGTRGIDRLQGATAPAAFHNSRERFDPTKCHPRTREAVLKKIMEWVQRKIDTEAFVMWLYGAAGAGKSAIAQTIAEMCYKEHLLLATFFFSRSDSQRNNTERLVASIAYQMIRAIPATRGLVEAAVEDDPLIFTQSLEAQFATLIVRPLEQLQDTGVFAQMSPPTLIILDGLDECMDGTQTNLLNIIPAVAAQSRHVVFLIASRAEQDISTAIRFGPIEQGLTQISLDDDYQTDDDIERFYLDKFEEIKRTHPLRSQIPPTWPSGDIIATLVRKASWQFIYASTVISYISSVRHRPTTRLDIILGFQTPRNENDTPFAQLDTLYRHIISSTEDPDFTLRLISICHILESSDLSLIEDILGLPRGDGALHLNNLAAIIECSEDLLSDSLVVRVLHASLWDFLLDKSRSRELYIDSRLIHAEISQWCIDKILEESPFDSDDLSTNAWGLCSSHLPHARLTPQLISDIQSVSFQEKLIASSMENASTVEFIECIKDMRFEGAEPLYMRYRLLCDEILISFFKKKSLNSVHIIIIWELFLNLAFDTSDLPERSLGNAIKRIFGGRHPRYCFSNIPFFIYSRDFAKDFLSDKARSGWYAIDQSHYTITAEKCIQHFLKPYHFPYQGMRNWTLVLKNTPWFWRKRHRSSAQPIYAYYRHLLWKLEDTGYNWHDKQISERALDVEIMLTILPRLLENASPDSASLVTLCRRLIPRRLTFFGSPNLGKAVRIAIRGYLSRVKAQEGAGGE